ncbi:MAG TPA: alpha/beta hydrolase [Gemmatimonadaceae bacterium]|nr:alpha/beta hydrolase [Gemmatimonadaceae bacterium]
MELLSVWDEIDGLRIHGRVSAPSGQRAVEPPIVFVHGLGVSTRYMEPTMTRLARTHTVVGLDLAGFGRSATPPRPFGVAEHARIVARWLDARGIGPAILVGNSYGCQVIVDCVARWPDRAVGLVLNAPTMDPAHRSAIVMLARVLADVPREPWRLAVIVARDYLRAGPRRILATLAEALRDRIEEKLPALSHPVLVVCGARDPVITARWASECARLVGIERPGAAGGVMQCVATAAHALPYDDPSTFADIITNFARHGVRKAPTPAAHA